MTALPESFGGPEVREWAAVDSCSAIYVALSGGADLST